MEHEITYDDIADYFISLSNETGNLITNLKLQKLVYYAQAWHLAIYENPLFDGQFEAWVHGPVLRELYNKYRDAQWRPLQREDLGEAYLKEFSERFGVERSDFMKDIANEYFGLTAYELERLTHLEEPWQKARAGLEEDQPSQNIIENQWMLDFYKQYVRDDA